jgi:hypothetical protein
VIFLRVFDRVALQPLAEKCKECNNGFFLNDKGECITPMDCAMAGNVPLGAYGGKCVSAGYSCDVGLDAGCKPPTSLGDSCEGFQVTSDYKLECTNCDETRYWFVNGVCSSKRVCFRKIYQDTGGRCSCNYKLTEPQFSLPMTDKYCGVCDLYKVNNPRTTYIRVLPTAVGLYRKCNTCRKRRVLVDQNFCNLVEEATCPSDQVMYSGVGASGAGCQDPFTCTTGVRTSGPQTGDECGCRNRSVCNACTWALDGYACTRCKKFTVLLDGNCIHADECIALGKTPVVGDGPKDGVCY